MKVQEWKKQEVEELKELIQEYPVVGVVDITSLPAMQLQKMRFKLKPDVTITMTKSRLLKIALDQIRDKKPGIEKLGDYVNNNIPMLIFSKKDSFRLSKFLIKNKSSAEAKPGQKAPNDITIPAGPTEFTPGPVIGELGQIGLKTGVEGGKIVIKEDKLIVREGDIINDKVSSVLAKLGFEPMKIGLNLLVTYDNGLIYEKEILDVNEEKYIANIKLAASRAFNMAFNIEFPTKENIKLLIQKAALESRALESKVNINLFVEEKQEIREEPKVEEKTEPVMETKGEKPIETKEVKKKELAEEPQVVQEEPAEEIKEEPKIEEKEEKIEQHPASKDRFEEDSQKAQELLKRLQDEKLKKPMKKPEPKKAKPIKKIKPEDILKE